jgi:hypothetical protein
MGRKEEVALLKVLGARMREGRQLCKFTTAQAAGMLNYRPEHLHNLEFCIDINYLPLTLIRDASNLYDVSIDFLFGVSEDWERSEDTKPLRIIHSYVYQKQLEYSSAMAVEIADLKRRQEALKDSVSELTTAVNGIDEALTRFQELNPQFDDMKAGAMLLNRVKSASKAAAETVLKLRRCHVNVGPKQSAVDI